MKLGFKTYEEHQKEVKQAKDYISRIGAPQHHFRDGSLGKLHACEVKTQVNHQSSSGATNYHDNGAFDLALAQVIRTNFTQLAAEALLSMEQAALNALVQEEDQLKERLLQVEQAKASLNE